MTLKPSTAILIAVVLILSAVSLGMYGSGGATAQPQGPTLEGSSDDLAAPLARFREVLDLAVTNAAAPGAGERAVYGGIDGMLRTLDPHSHLYRPDEFRELREQQSGTYSGLGITVSGRFGRVTIASPPFPGAPAEKVGLRVGDVITHVDGASIDGVELRDVVSLLKGPRGTAVEIRIVRPGVDRPLDIRIVRDEISRFTVHNVFRLRDDIAYVKVESFAETTADELREAIEGLGSVSGLILDLRNNPGGLMRQAIAVSELFLPAGQRILEIRGRTLTHTYAANPENRAFQYPLVVLINRQSASASEIVAGAVQDHDRGLIVGETSFGKGLVQSVYALPGNAGLALTTQKWYTPAGRLIQRDYSKISDFDYYNRPELAITPTQDEIYHSDLGRVVYGGGGITPDVVVPPQPLTPVEDLLSRSIVFYTFFDEYLAGRDDLDASFEVTDEMFADFLTHVGERGIDADPAALTAIREFIASRIRYEVFYNRFGVAEASRVQLEQDLQVKRAIELVPDAARLATRVREATGRVQ